MGHAQLTAASGPHLWSQAFKWGPINKVIAKTCSYCGRETSKEAVFCPFCEGHTMEVRQNRTRLFLLSLACIVAAGLLIARLVFS